MCIRDRVYIDSDCRIQQSLSGNCKTIGTADPVSYTHLDVYKRQGQSDVYIKNAQTLGESLSDLNGMILSHGHYDHCGGLQYLNEEIPNVYVREKAFCRKFSVKEEHRLCEIGIPWKKEQFLEKLVFTENVQQIRKNWFLLGNVSEHSNLEGKPHGFLYQDGDEIRQDCMEDEQFLAVKTKKGIILIIGCAHMGILNCVAYAKEIFPGEKIRGIFAGMHLKDAENERICFTIEKLMEENLEFVAAVHCTCLLYTSMPFLWQRKKELWYRKLSEAAEVQMEQTFI